MLDVHNVIIDMCWTWKMWFTRFRHSYWG